MSSTKTELVETLREIAVLLDPTQKVRWLRSSDAMLARQLEWLTVGRLKEKAGKAQFLIIHAISGTGKSTLGKMLESRGFVKLPLAYTRPKRPNEIEGKDYFFMSSGEFDKLLAQNKFAFSREVFGEKRGMFKAKLLEFLRTNKRFYVEGSARDYYNLKQIQAMEYLAVFLLPPSFKEWQRRLSEQAISREDIAERLHQRERLLDAGRMIHNGIETAFLVNDNIGRLINLIEPIFNSRKRV